MTTKDEFTGEDVCVITGARGKRQLIGDYESVRGRLRREAVRPDRRVCRQNGVAVVIVAITDGDFRATTR